jgi:hypothetical protein
MPALGSLPQTEPPSYDESLQIYIPLAAPILTFIDGADCDLFRYVQPGKPARKQETKNTRYKVVAGLGFTIKSCFVEAGDIIDGESSLFEDVHRQLVSRLVDGLFKVDQVLVKDGDEVSIGTTLFILSLSEDSSNVLRVATQIYGPASLSHFKEASIYYGRYSSILSHPSDSTQNIRVPFPGYTADFLTPADGEIGFNGADNEVCFVYLPTQLSLLPNTIHLLLTRSFWFEPSRRKWYINLPISDWDPSIIRNGKNTTIASNAPFKLGLFGSNELTAEFEEAVKVTGTWRELLGGVMQNTLEFSPMRTQLD